MLRTDADSDRANRRERRHGSSGDMASIPLQGHRRPARRSEHRRIVKQRIGIRRRDGSIAERHRAGTGGDVEDARHGRLRRDG